MGDLTQQQFDSLDPATKTEYLRQSPTLAPAPGHYHNGMVPGSVPRGSNNLADQMSSATNRVIAAQAAADLARKRRGR